MTVPAEDFKLRRTSTEQHVVHRATVCFYLSSYLQSERLTIIVRLRYYKKDIFGTRAGRSNIAFTDGTLVLWQGFPVSVGGWFKNVEWEWTVHRSVSLEAGSHNFSRTFQPSTSPSWWKRDLFHSRHFDLSYWKKHKIALTMAPLHSCVPVSHDSVTATRRAQY